MLSRTFVNHVLVKTSRVVQSIISVVYLYLPHELFNWSKSKIEVNNYNWSGQ